jgi:hypothetical protein
MLTGDLSRVWYDWSSPQIRLEFKEQSAQQTKLIGVSNLLNL